MKRRPLPQYTRFIDKDQPHPKLADELIVIYEQGGLLDLVGSDKVKLADVRLIQPSWTDPITKEVLTWKYVGRSWWCRRRKNNKYEFARMVALVNNGKHGERVVDGLWNCKKHNYVPDPEIVYRGGIKGYIVGYNKFEIMVEWEVGGVRKQAEPIRSLDNIEFEFEEDFRKYSKLFKAG